MSLFATALFVFLCGLTLAGLVGSVCEMLAGRRLALAAPFIARERPLRSVALTLVCGPVMVVNEGLERMRRGRGGAPFLAACLGVAMAWAFASGIVVVDIARRAGAWLG